MLSQVFEFLGFIYSTLFHSPDSALTLATCSRPHCLKSCLTGSPGPETSQCLEIFRAQQESRLRITRSGAIKKLNFAAIVSFESKKLCVINLDSSRYFGDRFLSSASFGLQMSAAWTHDTEAMPGYFLALPGVVDPAVALALPGTHFLR